MKTFVFTLTAVGITASQTLAAPLGLTQSAPDLSASQFLQYSYDSTTDLFEISSSSIAVPNAPMSNYSAAPGDPINNEVGFVDFSLSATIDEFGNLSSGTFSITNITGFFPYLGAADGEVLLAGTLNDFGYEFIGSGNAIFEFTGESNFGPSGGKLVSNDGINPLTDDFLNAMVGIIYATPSEAIDFTTSFGSTQTSGTIDTFFLIPEPTSALVGACGLIGLATRRRRNRCTA